MKKIISGIPIKKSEQALCKIAEPGIYYHYTSIESFWKIIESQTLRATQACFSNDKEEINKGINVVKKISKSLFSNLSSDLKNLNKSIEQELIDCYIVCFCKNNDVLSQWRAYCKNEGVCLGLAFDNTNYPIYYSDDNIGKIPQLHPVYYFQEKGTKNITKEYNFISYKSLLQIVKKRLNVVPDNETKKQLLLSLIPYIKDSGFFEENEYRLLIINKPTVYSTEKDFELDNCVYYSDDEKNKKPYIILNFKKKTDAEENPKDKEISFKDAFLKLEQPLSIRIVGCSDMTTNVESKIQELLYKNGLPKEKFILEKINGANREIIIGDTTDCIQKKVFHVIDKLNNSDFLLPIWCSGHLPLRSITVSPSQNQEQLINMLKHYCQHHCYWTKYVQITGSSIPYRTY